MDAPEDDALVPLDQQLGELIEILVLAAVPVELDERQPAVVEQPRERVPQLRGERPHGDEARRVEAAAVAEHPPDLLVLPGRHLLEHVDLLGDEHDAAHGSSQQASRCRELARTQEAHGLLELERASFSQSSDDWWVVWKSSSSRWTISPGVFWSESRSSVRR